MGEDTSICNRKNKYSPRKTGLLLMVVLMSLDQYASPENLPPITSAQGKRLSAERTIRSTKLLNQVRDKKIITYR